MALSASPASTIALLMTAAIRSRIVPIYSKLSVFSRIRST